MDDGIIIATAAGSWKGMTEETTKHMNELAQRVVDEEERWSLKIQCTVPCTATMELTPDQRWQMAHSGRIFRLLLMRRYYELLCERFGEEMR